MARILYSISDLWMTALDMSTGVAKSYAVDRFGIAAQMGSTENALSIIAYHPTKGLLARGFVSGQYVLAWATLGQNYVDFSSVATPIPTTTSGLNAGTWMFSDGAIIRRTIGDTHYVLTDAAGDEFVVPYLSGVSSFAQASPMFFRTPDGTGFRQRVYKIVGPSTYSAATVEFMFDPPSATVLLDDDLTNDGATVSSPAGYNCVFTGMEPDGSNLVTGITGPAAGATVTSYGYQLGNADTVGMQVSQYGYDDHDMSLISANAPSGTQYDRSSFPFHSLLGWNEAGGTIGRMFRSYEGALPTYVDPVIEDAPVRLYAGYLFTSAPDGVVGIAEVGFNGAVIRAGWYYGGETIATGDAYQTVIDDALYFFDDSLGLALMRAEIFWHADPNDTPTFSPLVDPTVVWTYGGALDYYSYGNSALGYHVSCVSGATVTVATFDGTAVTTATITVPDPSPVTVAFTTGDSKGVMANFPISGLITQPGFAVNQTLTVSTVEPTPPEITGADTSAEFVAGVYNFVPQITTGAVGSYQAGWRAGSDIYLVGYYVPEDLGEGAPAQLEVIKVSGSVGSQVIALAEIYDFEPQQALPLADGTLFIYASWEAVPVPASPLFWTNLVGTLETP